MEHGSPLAAQFCHPLAGTWRELTQFTSDVRAQQHQDYRDLYACDECE